MKKTIIILSHDQNDGSLFCTYIFEHAKALANLGNKVIVLVISSYFPFLKSKSRKEDTMVHGVDIRYYNYIGFSNFLYNSKLNINAYSYYIKAKKELKKILKKEKIDLINAHSFKVEGYAAALLKRKFKIKTCVTLHGTSFDRNLLIKNGRNQIRWVAKQIDLFICVSKKISNQLNNLGINNNKVIYNGMKTFKINRKNLKYNIATLGALISIKNIDCVIKAFAIIAKKYKKARLLIIGEGPLKKDLKDLTKKLKITNQVEFLGYIDNKEVYNIFSLCNIFSLLSKPEGFGIAYLESMFSGCIPIGTKGEGIDGFIEDGKNGFLVDVDEKKLAEKIEYIFNNDCKSIRENAINISSKQTWDKNAKEYMEAMWGKKNDR